MPSTQLKVLLPQIQCAQLIQIFRPQAREFIQQLRERFTLNLSHVSLPVKGLKHPSLAKLQNHSRPWHPVRAFAINQMADDFVRAPSVFTFIPLRPRFRQITQKRIKSGGSPTEE